MADQDKSTDDVRLCVITDRSGKELTAVEVDGLLIPPFPEAKLGNSYKEHFRKLKESPMREDDVIICGYPKAGTHWLWEVVQMLTAQTTEYKKQIKEKVMLEAANIADVEAEPSPRVLNSHLWPRHLPKQMFEKKVKILYLIRNPKDTVVSMFCHFHGMQQGVSFYEGTLQDFVDLFLHKRITFGAWQDHILEWERCFETTENPYFKLTYEDMQEKPWEIVKALAKFLQVDVTDDLCAGIVDACSFKKLKKANEEVKEDFLKHLMREGASLYRKGEVGDWKNWLTVAESERFDQMIAEKLKETKINIRCTL